METFQDMDRFNMIKQLCKFGKFVSPFLHQMLWTLLFDAVQAVNVIDTHDLSDFFFSDKNNKMYQFLNGGYLTMVRQIQQLDIDTQQYNSTQALIDKK